MSDYFKMMADYYWFWSERFLITHKFFIGTSWLPRLIIPVPFRVYLFFVNRQTANAKRKTQKLRDAGLIFDPDKK